MAFTLVTALLPHASLKSCPTSPAQHSRPLINHSSLNSSATIPIQALPSVHSSITSKAPLPEDPPKTQSSPANHPLLLAPELMAEPVRAQSNPSTIARTTTPALPNSNIAQANVNNKPVEFNYAINYVNKIKHRFIDQPEIYKTFLDILQTYQRDGMPIDSVRTTPLLSFIRPIFCCRRTRFCPFIR